MGYDFIQDCKTDRTKRSRKLRGNCFLVTPLAQSFMVWYCIQLLTPFKEAMTHLANRTEIILLRVG